jgi:hypothetical protein
MEVTMRNTLVAVALGAALFASAAPAEAMPRPGVRQVVHGRLLPPDAESDAHGKFRLKVKKRGEAQREFLYVDAWGLDARRDDAGNIPDYHVFLVMADGSAAADFGEMRLSARGYARLRWHSARDGYPDGVESIAPFAAGKVEVRLGDTVVLSGDVPEFLDLMDENEPGSGARVVVSEIARLHATEDGGRARGIVQALAASLPRGRHEALRVECWLLKARRGDELSVVCVDGDGNETRLGTMLVRTRAHLGVLRLSTRAGDEIPGGGVIALGGQTVEVRDADGVVHLTGFFPVLAD